MNKLYILGVAVIVSSCSSMEGKIESRKTSESCVTYFTQQIPDTSEIVPFEGTIEYEQYRINDSIDAAKEQELQNKRTDIEKDAQQTYLVNTSSTKAYSYTIKKTLVEPNISSTSIIVLEPGEEKILGCDTEISNDTVVKVKFEVVGQKDKK